jgi:putative SbcD/Mre11-related phosphoesterase
MEAKTNSIMKIENLLGIIMNVTPVYDEPALMIEVDRERVLVVSDLHLGLEGELIKEGISLPSQMPKLKQRLIELIERQRPDRLILLGDVKHNVPVTTWQEWRELPEFFSSLTKLTRVEVARGNHDGDLEGMVPSDVVIHGAGGLVIGKRSKVGLMHGHTWPSEKLLRTKLLVVAHNHPAVEFKDKLGARTVEPAWIKCKLEPSRFPDELRAAVKGDWPELLVMPAFSQMVGGAPVNKPIPDELLGPMFRAGAVRLEEAEVYLLDGTFLGTVGALRKMVEEG